MHLIRERLAIIGAGLWGGITMLPRDPELGLKRLLLPTSYWRLAEFAYVWRWIGVPPRARVLDLASPKELSCMLAQRRAYEVTSCDIRDSEVEQALRYASAQRLLGRGPGTVTAARQDARSLTFPDGWFDAAVAVSVIEHIPGNGDTAAIRELIRVVKPGGRIVITTPFDNHYRETYVDHGVYERPQQGSEAVFYERHYNNRALNERLLEPSGAIVLSQELWGERVLPVERILDRLGRLRTPLSPLEPILSTLFLHRQRTATEPKAVFLAVETPRKI